MPSGRGVTISVTAETDAGKRRHMEDYLDVRLTPNATLQKIPGLREQAFVGVFDGHGGKEAALYARERLWDLIQEQSKFRTTDREKVMEAITDAYLGLHREMEPMRQTWKPNKLGDLSTAGTTACTVIFRQDHFYVANVGDSSAVLATVNERAGEEGQPALIATMLSKDHKPEDPSETERVESLGGQVKLSRKGVPRVVWERKKQSDDPDKPPTIDFIPFLSVSRSLGDFWSWNEGTQQFVVSPQPDVHVHSLDPSRQRFLVLASDGLWNVMSPQDAIDFVWGYETRDDEPLHQTRDVVRALIDEALYRWKKKGMFADNISVVIAFLSQDGAPALGSSFAHSSQPVENGTAHQSVGGEGESDRSEEEVVVHHEHNTGAGSTVYHKETLPGGATLEEHTVISLRCRHKDKQRARREEEGEEKSRGEEGREEEERLPVKRAREEPESLYQPPPQKKSRQESDSGCESDSGSPTTEEQPVLQPVLAVEEASSGVDSSKEDSPSPLLSPPALASSECTPVAV